MNYQKKRNRQNGRQNRNGIPRGRLIVMDEWESISRDIQKLIAEGKLPKVSFELADQVTASSEIHPYD